MKSLKVTFENDRGQQLAGRLELPEDERPLAFALFAHCFTCTKNLRAIGQISRALSRERIAVLRFDFTGLGESEGDFAQTTFSSDVQDLVAAARFLEAEYEAPRLLIGHSLGGAAVLRAAAEIPTTTAVATIAAPARPDHLADLVEDSREEIEESGRATVDVGGRPFTITREFLRDLEGQDLEEVLEGYRGALLVLHSPRDRIVGIDNAADLYKAARHPKSFVSLDPADHLLSDSRDSHWAATMIAAWARRYLGSDREEGKRSTPATDHRVTTRTGTQGFRTEIFASGYSLVADEPEEYGGDAAGPSPYGYLLSALGACTGMTLQMYARRKGWPLEQAVVRLNHAKIHAEDCKHCEEKDGKIDRFERELELHGELDGDQRRRLLEIAERCPVHKTLMEDVVIETRLREDGAGQE